MTDDIVEFIEARLNEDERIASVCEYKAWTLDGASIVGDHPTDEIVDWVYDDGGWDHIVRHDPARILRDAAAKRDLLGLAQHLTGWSSEFDGAVTEHEIAMMRVAGEHLLRDLAAPFADHPDFRPEWSLS